MEEKQIAIFCDVDDFCKDYEEYCTHSLLMDKNEVVPKTRMSLSEIMTILIMYHLSGYRTFKWYYIHEVMKHQRQDFPALVSYNRFVEIMRYAFVPLLLYTIRGRFGKCSGISFVDSTPIKVCDNHRIRTNHVFSDYAKRGKSSMGWFYGFKLHLIINDEGRNSVFLPYFRKCR